MLQKDTLLATLMMLVTAFVISCRKTNLEPAAAPTTTSAATMKPNMTDKIPGLSGIGGMKMWNGNYHWSCWLCTPYRDTDYSIVSTFAVTFRNDSAVVISTDGKSGKIRKDDMNNYLKLTTVDTIAKVARFTTSFGFGYKRIDYYYSLDSFVYELYRRSSGEGSTTILHYP